MITICLAIYLTLGLVMICSLALIASRPIPQQMNDQPIHKLQEVQTVYNEADSSLRRAA